jgi:hypothetical protein
VLFKVFHDGSLEFGDAFEDAAAYAVSDDLGEETLNHVEPESRGGCEVHVEAATTGGSNPSKRSPVSGNSAETRGDPE